MKLADIGALVGGELRGDAAAEIERVAKIEEARPGDITFLANPKYRKFVLTTGASALLVDRTSEFPGLDQRPVPLHLIRCDDPYRAFLRLVDVFHPPPEPVPPGIHPTAVVAASASLGAGVAVGPHAVIGERCAIGDGCTIGPGTVLGNDVVLGGGSALAANVSIRERCRIGSRAVIHAGAVIGADGFGFAPTPDGPYEKIPQRGIVVIEDDVEIGANTTVDRATLGETRICRGVKLDNLVQVAHNVTIGEHTVIAGQSGISGSTRIGRYCRVAGQVGFAGHLEIADHTTFAAQTGVPKSLLKAGETYFGTPAREFHQRARIEAALTELPDLLVQVRSLKETLDRLERELAQLVQRSPKP